MALRENANMAQQDVVAGSGSGKSAPGVEEARQGPVVSPVADGGVPRDSEYAGKSAGAAEPGMTQNKVSFLLSFVKEGFASLSSRMDRSEKRQEKESSTLMDFFKQSFSSLSARMDRSEKAQEKRTEDLAERVEATKAKEKRARYLLRRMDRIAKRELKFFMWIMGGFGAMGVVLGVPIYLSFFNLG